MVSPGSARTVHVQSALFSYSDGKWGLEILLLVPRRVPPQAPSAAGTEEREDAVQDGLGHKRLYSVTRISDVFPHRDRDPFRGSLQACACSSMGRDRV